MNTRRIDGAKDSDSLLERINAGDAVGDGLLQRTKEDYARKIGIIAKKLKASGHDALTPSNITDYLYSAVKNKVIAQSTARSLKAAAIFWITEEAQNAIAQGIDLSEHEKAFKLIRDLSTRELPSKTDKTSSTKLKFFPKSTLDKLTDYANNSTKSKHAGTLVAFLRANLLVGLRPSEWFGAEFFSHLQSHDDEKGSKSTISLRIENAKTTYGRGNGTHREILLYGISDEDLATLIHFREIAQSFASKYPVHTSRSEISKAFFKPLQQTMTHALKRMGHSKNQLPTTYSTRHQVVSNAKSSGLSDREIAAMFGHSSTATAKSHYGKKMSGWRQVTFRPSPDSIAAVPVKANRTNFATPNQKTIDVATEWNRENN